MKSVMEQALDLKGGQWVTSVVDSKRPCHLTKKKRYQLIEDATPHSVEGEIATVFLRIRDDMNRIAYLPCCLFKGYSYKGEGLYINIVI